MKNNKAFTLIEILIVVSIIGLLSAGTLLGLGTFRQAGRDTRRMTDLRQIQNALELYYQKNGSYPAAPLSDSTFSGIGGIAAIPRDPSSGAVYEYSVTNCGSGISYVLAAILEDANNKALTDVGTICNIACTKASKKFCISL